MQHLTLLFTKDGLQYQSTQGKNVVDEASFFVDETSPKEFILNQLNTILALPNTSSVNVISALNHFTMMPEGFSQHELAYDLISYNAPVDRHTEEVMLSLNKKYQVQFYYTLPKHYYQSIKQAFPNTHFNFSGEQFLNRLSTQGKKEIHINLYHHQCEFFALNQGKVVLYNNLDINSEVDFLYFIMFTLSKIGFGLAETRFFVYGETTENDTFISELNKFVGQMKVVFDNLHKKNFIMMK
ncbi:DUF3822 family protein [Riemerella columbina]|uniref:DUF3822 family protein n=1 Tax=Riemerella columbina TaxID=103810 RepID=UPI00037F8520|nr:DUF3822 family protein [Riemerella columbina]